MACRPFHPDACYPSHLTPSPRSFPHSTRFRLLLSVHQPLGRSVARSQSGFPLWLTAPSLTPMRQRPARKKESPLQYSTATGSHDLLAAKQLAPEPPLDGPALRSFFLPRRMISPRSRATRFIQRASQAL